MTKPVEVLFEGVDTNVYKKLTKIESEDLKAEFEKIPEKNIFLYTGHWLQGNLGNDRKDTGMLIKTFLETFKNYSKPPALLLKTSGANFSIIDRNDIADKIASIKDSVKGKLPNIYFLHGDLTDEEMNEMYNHPKIRAHITFTHGEGFGRPLLEASLSEKPVVAPNWSGHIDFLTKTNAILLPGALTDVSTESFPKEMIGENAKWFTINYQYASQVMKKLYKSNRKEILNAKKLANYNRGKFSLKAMTSQFSKILDNYLPKFEQQPQQVNLNLPKLKKVGENSEPPKLKLPKLKKV